MLLTCYLGKILNWNMKRPGYHFVSNLPLSVTYLDFIRANQSIEVNSRSFQLLSLDYHWEQNQLWVEIGHESYSDSSSHSCYRMSHVGPRWRGYS